MHGNTSHNNSEDKKDRDRSKSKPVVPSPMHDDSSLDLSFGPSSLSLSDEAMEKIDANDVKLKAVMQDVKELMEFQKNQKASFEKEFSQVKVVIIDEFSMLSQPILGKIDKRLKQAKGNGSAVSAT